MGIEHDAIANAHEIEQIVPFDLIPIGKNAAAHDVEQDIGKMMRRCGLLSGKLQAIGGGNIADQIGGALGNVRLDFLLDNSRFLAREC